MAIRVMKLLGENRASMLVNVRHFTASRNFWVAGAPGSGTEGTKDMDSGERESESSENPQDAKQREDDGKTDRDEELQEKPVAQVGIEKVRDNLAGSST